MKKLPHDITGIGGQMGNMFIWLGIPLVIGGLIASAVAIPLALDDSDSEPEIWDIFYNLVSDDTVPMEVQFTPCIMPGDGEHDYDWDFGDGSEPNNGYNPFHIFMEPNQVYTVTLTVTDEDGDTASDSIDITTGDLFGPPIEIDQLLESGSELPDEMPEYHFDQSVPVQIICYPEICSISYHTKLFAFVPYELDPDSWTQFYWDFGDGGSYYLVKEDIEDYEYWAGYGFQTHLGAVSGLDIPPQPFLYVIFDLASHQYEEPGIYIVNFTVWTEQGCGQDSISVEVGESVDDIGVDNPYGEVGSGLGLSTHSLHINATTTQGQVPFVVNFNCTVSGLVEPLSYFWSFGENITCTTQKDPWVRFTEVGTHVVRLYVTDRFGVVLMGIIEIYAEGQIHELNPFITIDPTASGGSEGQAFDIHGVVLDSEGAVSYKWYKDDVLFEEGDNNVQMTFSEAGRHYIGLAVEDSEGKTGYCEEIVWISFDTSPTVHFRYSDVDRDPYMIAFSGGIFEGDRPVTCIWDFGDGNSFTSVPIFGIGAWIYTDASHYYNGPGEYMVTLTVIDEDGDEGFYWDIITVEEMEEW